MRKLLLSLVLMAVPSVAQAPPAGYMPYVGRLYVKTPDPKDFELCIQSEMNETGGDGIISAQVCSYKMQAMRDERFAEMIEAIAQFDPGVVEYEMFQFGFHLEPRQ
jgi:hypothetical protein